MAETNTPNQCGACGTYEPIAELIRVEEKRGFTSNDFQYEFECASDEDCARRIRMQPSLPK